MATLEIVGLHSAIEHPDTVTHANFSVVHNGVQCSVDLVKVPAGWFVTTCGEEGALAPDDMEVTGSFTDAALYGIGLALDQSRKPLVTT